MYSMMDNKSCYDSEFEAIGYYLRVHADDRRFDASDKDQWNYNQ